MAKIGAISDLHYHNYKSHSVLENGINSRCKHVDMAVEAAMRLCKDMEVDLFTCTGDVFHERGRIRPSVFNMAFNRFKQMAQVAPIAIDIGNHDMEDFRLGASSVDTFESIDRCYVFGGSDGYSRLDVRGIGIIGIQYFHKTDDFKRVFEEAIGKWGNPDIVMIHQGIDDFDHHGIPETKITCEYLRSVTSSWVLSGHYHSPQSDGKIINVGAPLQHSFGDEGIERGCWVIDTDADKATFHPLDVTPKFVTVQSKTDISNGVDGSFVRVVAKTPRTAKTLEKAAQAAGALSVATYVDKEYTTAHQQTVAISTNPKKMVSDFCDLVPKFKPKKDDIVSMWERVCA